MNASKYLPITLLKGQTVFVTGGGSGINLGIAKSFASVGADVAICGRTAERLEAAAAELRHMGARVSTSVADVRDYAAVEAALAKSREELGPVHTMVCGAAGNFVARAEAISAKGFRTVVEIDLLGAFHGAHAAFAQLKETRGNLIFVSAGQAYLPFAFQAHVGAAKAGIDNLMRNLALEWGRHGIRSNSIVPGPIEGTEGMKRLGGAAGDNTAGEDTFKRMVPLGRYGTVDDIGGMAVVLASPLGAYVTGAQIVVDGGIGLQGSGLFNQAVERAMPPSP
ncbi:SDR family oxidoreductase [Phreatobacter stygius]|uniref:SDR family oxidoreductase n=1 Tax=Phreatobacter stygius TaxID=1940610 RepID=A0A4D7B647_9HYPH|nr:SDR family oxidoreductase [Phreatobacter stygius]QCI68481.1 SDR family oxidoreductase [Phreatobacter stygius]